MAFDSGLLISLSSHESTNLLLATTQFISLHFSSSLSYSGGAGSYIRCVVRQTVMTQCFDVNCANVILGWNVP